jgi:hypothetical protein
VPLFFRFASKILSVRRAHSKLTRFRSQSFQKDGHQPFRNFPEMPRRKNTDLVQLGLDVAPVTKQTFEFLHKRFGFKTKAQTFSAILQQISAQEKIPAFREQNAIEQILLGIESKLDRLVERFEDAL